MIEGVLSQVLDIAFDGLEIIGTGEEPRVTLLGAYATVALEDSFDLWSLQLKDECTTMAVATICLGGLFCHTLNIGSPELNESWGGFVAWRLDWREDLASLKYLRASD